MLAWRTAILLGIFYALVLCVRITFLLQAEVAETLSRHIYDKRAVVSGVVVDDPEQRANSLHVYVAVSDIDGVKTNGTLLAILARDTGVSYGDKIELEGQIILPQSFETDTGRVFDYQNYLRVRGVSAIARYATLTQREPGPWSLQKSLFDFKHLFVSSLERIFHEPRSALLEGVLLGERRGLPKDINDAFITSGLIHVVVLSGYNIAVVANAVLYMTSFLPRTLGVGASGVLMVLFVVMTGAGATAVRACIMGLIAVLALYLRRPTAALRALVFAALGMVLWNPLVALYDPSFILSVLATFGLITISPTVEKYLTRIPEYLGLRSITASTIAVQMYVLPALLYFTGVLSFLSVPANFLALPVIPLAMLFGFLAGLLGLVYPLFALPFMILSDTLLRWILFVAQTAHLLPFSSTVLPAFPAWVVILAYVPLTWLAIRLYLKTASQQRSS